MDQEITARERWLAATSYLFILVVIPILSSAKSEFLARHCRQGFAVFCLEVVSLVLLGIVDVTLGLIPVLGFILIILLRLVLFLLFLVVSALGFAKALFGESWRIPYVDEWSERLPIH